MLRWFSLVSAVLISSFSLAGCEHMSFLNKNSIVDVNAKRPGDERTLRSITLKNNLTVLLISDPQLNKSAAAMDIGIGSLANPKDQLGLAHFLEHMLFLGTKKYPDVEDYSQYLAKYSGQSNAYTDEEDTNYYFEVNHDGFEGALDRFAQFFIEPLFNPEYVERELHAVDSEHQKNLKSDSWRVHRIYEMLHKNGHPRQKFATGNSDTLKGADKETIIKFYKNHYSANLMKLAMMSSLSLDEMEKLTREKFSDIPNYDHKRPVYDSEIFTPDQLPRLVQVKSVKKLHRMELSFASESERPYWKSKPASAITYILGHEGEGSLLSLLKKEGLVSKLEAASDSSTFTGTLHVNFELTEKGEAQWKDIIKYFFSYVELMRKEGYKRYLFDERKTMADIDYYYREPREGGHVVSDYAVKMQYYSNPISIDHDDLLVHEYNEKEYNQFLSYIQPEKLNIFLISDKVQTNQSEKFYGVEYREDKLDSAFIKDLQTAENDKRMSLPKPNPYIPEHLELIVDKSALEPRKIVDNEWGAFWFQSDNLFKIPKASMRLLLLNEKTNDSPYHKMMSQLYSEAINESLNEWAYTISLAGLHLDLSQTDRGIQIDISGYAEKIPQLLAELSQKLTNITIDNTAFENIKTDLKRKVSNTVLNAAYWQTLYEMKYASNRNMIHNFEFFDPVGKKVDLITPVKFDDVKKYAKEVYSVIAIEGAAYGSLDAARLAQSVERFTSVYNSTTLPKVKRPKEEIIVYPSGKDLALVRHSYTNNNSWGMTVQFGPRDLKLNAVLRVGHAHLQQSFFSDLRTRQQLGYIVASYLSINEHVLGLLFLIQSSNFTPFDIAQRASHWMKGAVEELEKLTPEEFEAYKQGVIRELREKDKTIQEKLENLYFESVILKGHFHYKEDVAKSAESITKKDMIEIYKKALLGPQKASLSVYHTTEQNPKEKPSGDLVQDLRSFKSKSKIYE